MRILVLTAYFTPDLSAGSFRSASLVDALGQDNEVEVVTAMPHRYGSHAVAALELETQGGVTIRRIAVPAHDGSMIGQIRSYARYFFGTLWYLRGRQYDVVFATSSRLLTGFLGAVVSVWKRRPLYLDIRDIFVDTLKDVLPGKLRTVVRPFTALIERLTVGRAATVNLVSRGFEDYFRARYPRQHYTFLTNGIDDFVGAALPPRPSPDGGVRTVVYAGNIGEGQGIEHILPPAAKALDGRARFLIYGDGARRAQLEQRCTELGVDNVTICKPVSRQELLRVYADADALLVHLNAYDAFLKVLPSKIFEYGALGRPILAGVAGYPAAFLREHLPDATVFAPQDVDGFVAAVDALDQPQQIIDRHAFRTQFDRRNISRELARGICALGRDRN